MRNRYMNDDNNTVDQHLMSRTATSENVLSDMCAQQRFRSACASALSDQNLRCPYEETLHAWLSKNVASEDSDQTARMCRLI